MNRTNFLKSLIAIPAAFKALTKTEINKKNSTKGKTFIQYPKPKNSLHGDIWCNLSDRHFYWYNGKKWIDCDKT